MLFCRARLGARRGERGAAAVEGATVTAFFILPLLVGVLTWGYYLWQAQKTPVLDPSFDQSGIVGPFCANQLDQLVSRVRTASLVASENLDTGDTLPISASDVTARVVSYVPGELGVVVSVRFSTNVVDEVAGMVPLPHDGNVVSESQVRLENVLITSESC